MPELSRPEQLERDAFLARVKTAIAKNAGRQELTPEERNAWKKFELEEDQRRGRRFVANVPKKVYSEWAGRQTKILHDQADLYGIPVRAPTISLPDVIAWLHDFLARWKHDLAPLVKGDRGGDTDRPPTLKEQLLQEQVLLYRKKNELQEEQLAAIREQTVPIAEVHKRHIQMATVLRAAGERLAKQFGEDARSILDVALDDVEALIEEEAKTVEDASPSVHAAPSS